MSILTPESSLAGLVHTSPVADALFRAYRNRATGRLRVTLQEGDEVEVMLRSGYPIHFEGSVEDARRGAWLRRLVDNGLIEQDTARQVLSQGRVPWAQALKVLPADAQPMVLSMLILWRLEALLSFTQCETRFIEDRTYERERAAFTLHPLVLLDLNSPLVDALPDERRVFSVDPDMGLDNLPAAWASLAEVATRTQESVQGQVDAVCRVMALEPPEAMRKLMTLWRSGHLAFGLPVATPSPEVSKPAGPVQALEALDFFARLKVTPEATAEEVEAAYRAALQGLPSGEHQKALKALYDEAHRCLLDDERRLICAEALDLGQDPRDEEVMRKLTVRHVAAEGRRHLEAGDYEAAALRFSSLVKLVPEDPMAHVNYAWSAFLGSERDETAAKKAAKRMRRAMDVAPDMDAPLLYVGKIYRLAGMAEQAEKALKMALELNPRNTEARSELRLVTSRVQKKSSRSTLSLTGGKTVKRKTSKQSTRLGPPNKKRAPVHDASMMVPAMSAFFAVFLLMFVGANLLPGGSASPPVGGDPWPQDLRKLGNQEYYYVISDIWWWIRRLVLIGVGVLGLRWLNNKKAGPEVLGEDLKWIGVAAVYGLAVGFFTPIQQVAGGATVLLMTLIHVTAEQLFFMGFIYTALSRALKRPEMAVLITGLLFGLYHMSFMSILRGDIFQILIEVTQIAGFAGMAYAALAWRSGGLVAPFVAHLAVNMTMMISTLSSQGG
ncbi:MAG: type II CAAX prenyl endopeptidase Rce1 family protein [Bradymonadia bacterium]